MNTRHPKAVRRKILQLLYAWYRKDPLHMMSPEDFFASGEVTREELGLNIHYLADRDLVELMIGYNPPLFTSARISPDGIDLIENSFQFDLQFPPELSELEGSMAALPHLIEALLVQAEISPVDGEARRAMLRDVQYLRDEVARPAERWRREVIGSVLDWIAAPAAEVGAELPAMAGIRNLLDGKGV